MPSLNGKQCPQLVGKMIFANGKFEGIVTEAVETTNGFYCQYTYNDGEMGYKIIPTEFKTIENGQVIVL